MQKKRVNFLFRQPMKKVSFFAKSLIFINNKKLAFKITASVLCIKLKIYKMNVVINGGSENKGGCFEQAKINAERWLKAIHGEGFLEVEMYFIEQNKNGTFKFAFKHLVTKKSAFLDIHGFTEEECQKFMFRPREYWNGSSTADPQIEDWLADGFKYKVEYYTIN